MTLSRLICAAQTAVALTAAALTTAALTAVVLCPGARADSPWAVPDPAAPAQTLPDRPDLGQNPDLQAALTRSLTLFGKLNLTEPTFADKVLALDLDPRAAFDLVQRLHSIPYGGRLRDPASVLAAGGGNAHDKAATLAALLAGMGYDTRLVTGTAPSAGVALTCGSGAVDAEVWRLTGLGQAVLARIPVRAAASYRVLRPLLDPPDQSAPDQPAPDQPAPDQPAPDTGPHVWLQMRDGADWVDLDPWAPDTPWGDHPAGTGDPLVDPPAPQTVVVSLTREVLREGGLIRDTILEERLDMPEAAQSLVALGFGPVRTGIGSAQTGILTEVVDGAPDMVARLIINGRTVESSAFAVPGVASGGAGFLGEGGTEVTTGLWLTVTSTVPGAADHAETRRILDLVPDAQRRSGVVEVAALIAPAPGARYPRALEGLQQLILSNGGSSRRLMAARAALQVADLSAVVARLNSGALDPWDMIHASWLEAMRVALAAEVLIDSRPAHGGACAVVDRPRVMIWGIAPLDATHDLRWLDWTLDDIGLLGGNAVARAEARLWQATLSAALEKEALLRLAQAPADAIPLDAGAMVPRDPAAMAAEQAEDQARGFAVLTSAGMGDGAAGGSVWWRLDQGSGRADARTAGLGNAWWLSALNFSRAGVVTVSEAAAAAAPSAESAEMQALYRQAVNQVNGVRAAEAERPNCFDSNGYLTLLCNVSIPASIAIGTTVVLIEVAVITAGAND